MLESVVVVNLDRCTGFASSRYDRMLSEWSHLRPMSPRVACEGRILWSPGKSADRQEKGLPVYRIVSVIGSSEFPSRVGVLVKGLDVIFKRKI